MLHVTYVKVSHSQVIKVCLQLKKKQEMLYLQVYLLPRKILVIEKRHSFVFSFFFETIARGNAVNGVLGFLRIKIFFFKKFLFTSLPPPPSHHRVYVE